MSAETIMFFPAYGSVQRNAGLLQPELVTIREVYRQILASEDFPYCCKESSWRLLGQGFRSQAGWFYTDLPDDLYLIPTRNFRTHTWNTLDRKIIDLVAFQFNPYMYDDCKLPNGIIIVEKGNRLYERYFTPQNPVAEDLGLSL